MVALAVLHVPTGFPVLFAFVQARAVKLATVTPGAWVAAVQVTANTPGVATTPLEIRVGATGNKVDTKTSPSVNLSVSILRSVSEPSINTFPPARASVTVIVPSALATIV